MAATLTKLKGFVQTYQGYNFENISNAEKDELTSFVSEIVQAIRWEIDEDFNQRLDDPEKNKYIVNIQSQLAYLADEVSGFEDKNVDLLNPAIFDWLLTETFKLLEHLRYYFPDYFNFEAKLPYSYIEWYRKGHLKVNNLLINKLHETNVDQDLIKLIADFNQSDLGEERFKIKTWKQLDYLVFAIEALAQIFSESRPEDMNLEILKLFITLDFNSIYVYSYFIKYLERFTLGEGSFQEQQQDLLYILKVFRQVRVDAKVPYDSRVQSLKISVVESLEAELNYLEQREKLYLQNFKATNPESPSKFYFNVAVTLAELMFFFRVMLEVKVIYTKFNSYLYEFISNHIRTERAENISKKSMRNHFNNKPFPDRVVQTVKSWLVKMVAHIDLYYIV